MADYTPMMKQYFEIKERHQNCILFFRLGDFYEMFFDDAKLVSQELELTLTGRDCGQAERAPMCGVPFHSYESYVARLVAKGYKVAICEQTEDPSQAQGLVKRDVVRIITPGTVIEGSMLDEAKNNYLAVVWLSKTAQEAGLAFVDSSTGEVQTTVLEKTDVINRITNELARFSPSEVLVNEAVEKNPALKAFFSVRLHNIPDVADDAHFNDADCTDLLLAHFQKDSLAELELEDKMPAVRALGCAMKYLYATQMGGLSRLTTVNVYSDMQFMGLDVTTRRNLELIETMRNKDKVGSLLGVLDRTKTAMGKRLIRNWIEQPLVHLTPISRRHNAVQELLDNAMMRRELMGLLSDVYDLERIMTRIVYGSANAKELRSLYQTIEKLPPIKEQLSNAKCALLSEICGNIDLLTDVFDLIDRAIVDDPPFSVREGGIIKKGFHQEIDELNRDMTDGKGIISRIEADEKEKTGIKNLKVGYNRVFGYYIEISHAYTGEIPLHYIRKQTLANAERYITQELKELEARVLGARERVIALEYQVFTQIRQQIAEQLHRIQQTANALATLDVLCSFAEVAFRKRYCRPEVDMSGVVNIKNGRHPVVEVLSDAPFIPNDTYLDKGDSRVAMITGPNMAGKSTYMRQTALIVLMAQIGSFVPADSATVGIVSSIFTRVGASDDLAAGQSTFMVEMSEVAHILKNANADSLVVFDEIGRGTSTFDGMSIARAVLEYVVDTKKIGAKTLFATHYHELTAMEDECEGVKNYNIAAKKRGDDITFLRRIVRGPADESYGIEVAKLAGVPAGVVSRAKEILASIESDDEPLRKPARRAEMDDGQMSLLVDNNPVIEKLKALDVNTLTPIEALQELYALTKEASAY